VDELAASRVILPRIPTFLGEENEENEDTRQCVIIMSSGGYDIYGVGATGGERDEREGIVAGSYGGLSAYADALEALNSGDLRGGPIGTSWFSLSLSLSLSLSCLSLLSLT